MRLVKGKRHHAEVAVEHCGLRRTFQNQWSTRGPDRRELLNSVFSPQIRPMIVFVHEALIALLLLHLCMSVCDSQPATDFFAERKQMVEEQLAAPGRDIKNQRVLNVMATVPRHEFVPKALERFAYV